MNPALRVTVLLLIAIAIVHAEVRGQGEAPKSAKFPHHVLIIRHAVKTGAREDIHLSKKGVERATVLFQLFEATKERSDPYPRPDFIFAASNSANSERPLETVSPLGKKLKITINQEFESTRPSSLDKADPRAKSGMAQDMSGLRDEILGQSKYAGKTILVSWRHSSIPELAKLLGAVNAPSKWEDSCYDRVWQLTFSEKGQVVFSNRPQRLLPGDAQQ